jgi:hypothetical protein
VIFERLLLLIISKDIFVFLLTGGGFKVNDTVDDFQFASLSFLSLKFFSFVCSRVDAQPTFNRMVESNRRYLFMYTLPYKVGISVALIAALASFPMCFDYNTVLWFNELYVTAGMFA